MKYIDEIILLSQRYEVSPYLVLATISVESSWDESAVSPKGALGLMQILPTTAKYVSDIYHLKFHDLLDPIANLTVGIAYLSYLSERFEGDWVIVAYNAGETIARTWIRNAVSLADIPYAETSQYLIKVRSALNIYQNRYSFAQED